MLSSAVDSITLVEIDKVQAVALAVVTYYFGLYTKKKFPLLNRFSVPAPVVGGMTFAVLMSSLESAGVIRLEIDGTLQTVLMLAFFTTIGLMASVKIITEGGRLLAGYLAVVTLLLFLQNFLGMGLAALMGLDAKYGMLAGSVSLMGGLGTSAAFGPYFEQMYGIAGATAVGVTSATFGMATALMTGGPFGEWCIRHFGIETPEKATAEKLVVPDELRTGISAPQGNPGATLTEEIMRAGSIVAVCMGLGTVVSDFLGEIITLPAYIGSMIVAALMRNIADFSGKFTVQGPGLDAVAEISLVLFVTMAINSLKLYELADLALPLIVILIGQTLLMMTFAYACARFVFGKSYDGVMLSVGEIGFAMGSTANGLACMQALSEKYGPSPRAWLIVSLVGAFLIDLVNALAITWMVSW